MHNSVRDNSDAQRAYRVRRRKRSNIVDTICVARAGFQTFRTLSFSNPDPNPDSNP